MATSRIFVKGLPPTINEGECRKHFSQDGTMEVTDARIFPDRRIGYIGYKTPEDASRAVKYFNKTFMRMSRIGVEVARPANNMGASSAVEHPGSGNMTTQVNGHRESTAGVKRKRDDGKDSDRGPQFQEFLDVMKPKKSTWDKKGLPVKNEHGTGYHGSTTALSKEFPGVKVPKPASGKNSQVARSISHVVHEDQMDPNVGLPGSSNVADAETTSAPSAENAALSDAEWARTRTSRLLGLLDDEDDQTPAQHGSSSDDGSELAEDRQFGGKIRADSKADTSTANLHTNPPLPQPDGTNPKDDVEATQPSARLFVRNLPYDVSQQSLHEEFSPFGNLEEVHVPLDKKSGSAKGFAYIQFSDPESAESAMVAKDGQSFQGRLLHVLPSRARKETRLDDFELEKLPLKKQQQIKKRREAASTTFNWNALYMNPDAVVSSVAAKLGISKSDVLDPTSADAAIKQAHAETHIIQETKAYFQEYGVDLDSFKSSARGDTTILAKNIPYDCSRSELERLFGEHGEITKLLLPPSGAIAIVEFVNAAQCKSAFAALAYRKIKGSVLFLEKAPKGVFDAKVAAAATSSTSAGISKTSAAELKSSEHDPVRAVGTATLFVRNLNFSTTSKELSELFSPLAGFLSARVKTKTDPKKPGQVLSMGFGFVEFHTSNDAKLALRTLDGFTLAGHKLQIRASHKGIDAAAERRQLDDDRKTAGRKTKISIKNLPFEATKKDVRSLFGAYGQLRSVRVPRKMDRAIRGFAFADFLTPKEAESAMSALKDTHLLGRRLVLEFADAEPDDPEAEIEKMQAKVGAQVNKVALQDLTGGGRKKFTTQNDDDEE